MVPKTIYMCYKNLETLQKYSQIWKNLNPEYEIKLFDNELCKKFLLEEFSQLHVDIFDYLKDGPIKADFWRLCILYKYGGLYVDADIKPIVPLREYIEDDDYFVSCISKSFLPSALYVALNPHFILAHNNDPLLERCINKYIKYYNEKRSYDYWRWSIVDVMRLYKIHYPAIEFKSQICYYNDKKIKFLLEDMSGTVCTYDEKIVLHNHHDDYKNHQFICDNVEKDTSTISSI
jgi:hypothetical protein